MREIIHLVSSAGTGYFYTTMKNKNSEKLRLKKYDPKVKRHVEFVEKKVSSGSKGNKGKSGKK